MPMASRQMQHLVIPKGREVCVHQYRDSVFCTGGVYISTGILCFCVTSNY